MNQLSRRRDRLSVATKCDRLTGGTCDREDLCETCSVFLALGCFACLSLVRGLELAGRHSCEPGCETCGANALSRSVVAKCGRCAETEAWLATLAVVDVPDGDAEPPRAWRPVHDPLMGRGYSNGRWIVARVSPPVRNVHGFTGYEWAAVDRERLHILPFRRYRDAVAAIDYRS